MGKKGSWFSAIKRMFMHNSKERHNNELESKNPKETKKKVRGLRHGDTKSFFPIFREPSSIEKILGEVDEQHLFIRPPTPFEPPKTPSLLTSRASSPRVASPKANSTRVTSPRATSQRVPSPKASSSRDVNRHKEVISYRPEPTLQYRHLSATKIQTAYRGYMARRSFRALRGLVRLQGVVRGQNVKRQTANTMKMMQLLVRVQTQIQSQRIQMLQSQSLRRQAHKSDKTTLGKWATSRSEVGNQEDWDDSTLTKDEREARMHKKMEAALKRERTMAYAYSHQSWKSNPKSAQASVPGTRHGGFPWWWNWLERRLPATANHPESQSMQNFSLTPMRRTPEPNPSPRPHSTYKPPLHIAYDSYDAMTPTSTRSMAPLRSKHFMPTPTHKTPPQHSSGTMKFPKTKPGGSRSGFETGLKDDDSLMSCPPFSAPNYMTPTASAKAKARSSSNPKERFPGTPGNDSKRRFSFPLTPNIGPFKWGKGSSKKDSGSEKVLEKHQSFQSGGDFGIDSAISMPAAVGRKPFNRFV